MNRRHNKDYKLFSHNGMVYRAWLVSGELHVLCARKSASHAWHPLPRTIAKAIWNDYQTEKKAIHYDTIVI